MDMVLCTPSGGPQMGNNITSDEIRRRIDLATSVESQWWGRRDELIASLEAILSVCSQAAFPVEWAGIQVALGKAHAGHLLGMPREVGDGDLERAIAHFEAALIVRTRKAFPLAWADIQNHLGKAYAARMRGDRGENLERAIAHFEA